MSEVTPLQIERCKADTLEHIKEVGKNINLFIKELIDRAEHHDASKLEEPELSGYAAAHTKLSDVEYQSEEYKKNLEALKPTIEHHYRYNRHHPQYHFNSIKDMTLVDLIEMLADWKAATLRNKNGNIYKSIDFNARKFDISPELQGILENTVRELFQD